MQYDVLNESAQSENQIRLSSITAISAIYFALLQYGYEYFAPERSQSHITCIRHFAGANDIPSFFAGVKQDTCDVYPYWPRAAILETASFYLLPDFSDFRDYAGLKDRIMSAANLSDHERDQNLWNWLADFPSALSKTLEKDTFLRYFEWEQKWLSEQSAQYENELQIMKNCLNVCVSKYDSSVQEIKLVISPIKCIYSADYHLYGNRFVFVSGAFRVDSVIHEFLHHVVHPVVTKIKDLILSSKGSYAGIDASYYLTGNDMGQLNAFEEYAVQTLTTDIMTERYPDNLSEYLQLLV